MCQRFWQYVGYGRCLAFSLIFNVFVQKFLVKASHVHNWLFIIVLVCNTVFQYCGMEESIVFCTENCVVPVVMRLGSYVLACILPLWKAVQIAFCSCSVVLHVCLATHFLINPQRAPFRFTAPRSKGTYGACCAL